MLLRLRTAHHQTAFERNNDESRQFLCVDNGANFPLFLPPPRTMMDCNIPATDEGAFPRDSGLPSSESIPVFKKGCALASLLMEQRRLLAHDLSPRPLAFTHVLHLPILDETRWSRDAL